LDIIGGSKEGKVYFYKNIGKLGKPAFGEEKCILEPIDFSDEPNVNDSDFTNIAVSDYNNDGKLDLIICNTYVVQKLRSDLTSEQIKEAKLLQQRIKKIENKKEICFYKNTNEKYKDYDKEIN
jgi:hypothetical protein